jgi:hypothetical protein
MKFSSVFFATAAAASVLETRQGKCNLPATEPAQFRKKAERKYFSVGSKSGSSILQEYFTHQATAYTLKGNPNAGKPVTKTLYNNSRSHSDSYRLLPVLDILTVVVA